MGRASRPLPPSTLKLCGGLNIAFGICAALMGLCALAMLSLQEVVRASMPDSQSLEAQDRFHELMTEAWTTYMPLGAVLGALFAVAGVLLMRGLRAGRFLSWLVVLGEVAWFFGYMHFAFDHRDELFGAFSDTFGRELILAVMAFSWLAMAATMFSYPAVLLFVLRRPFASAEPVG